MSTAGKVLSVIVILALFGWLCLMSMVARLNANWGQVVVAQDKKLESLQKEMVDTRDQLAKVKNDIAFAQEVRDKDIVTHRIAMAKKEKILSDTTETLERAKNQVKGQQASQATAEEIKKRRTDELAETHRLLAEARDDVRKLIAQNKELGDRLDELQKNFISARAENQKLLKRTTY
ncbi:MAG TPA: hypothetical protein VGZ22_13935 [Isosphaeraceae bacterium]|jgi:chromosome segregation ATPase|nr:hypothetical protein [Isosphaeraceae bacterium]